MSKTATICKEGEEKEYTCYSAHERVYMHAFLLVHNPTELQCRECRNYGKE
jgi:hypothetical protein